MKNEKPTSTSFHLCLGVIIVMGLCGCTPKAIITIDDVSSQQIVKSPIGVLVLVPEKRIEFFESCLYKIFWYEGRDNYYTFEGIWEPGTFLREHLVKTLRTEFNLTTTPLWDNLEPEAYGKLVKTCEDSFNKVRTLANARPVSNQCQGESAFFVEWSEYAPEEYLKSAAPELISSLRETSGVEFILELSLAGIAVVRSCAGITNMEIFVYGRLIRLSDGAVIWLDKGSGYWRKFKYKKFADLEQDNMKLLREYYEKSVIDLLDPKKGDLHGASFFKGLFPKQPNP